NRGRPTAPPFPYTTLFRSARDEARDQRDAAHLEPPQRLEQRDRDRRRVQGAEVIRPARNGAVVEEDAGKEEARRPHHARIGGGRSEEHTSELQSRENLVCR